MLGHDDGADQGVEGVLTAQRLTQDRRSDVGVSGVVRAFPVEVRATGHGIGLVDRAGVEAGVHFDDQRFRLVAGKSRTVEGPHPEAGFAEAQKDRHTAEGCGANTAGAADLEDAFRGDASDAGGALGFGDVGDELAVDVGGAEHAVDVVAGELGRAFVGFAPKSLVGVAALEPSLAVLLGDEVPELWAGVAAVLALHEPLGEAEAEVEADDQARSFLGQCDEPIGCFLAGAAVFKGDNAVGCAGARGGSGASAGDLRGGPDAGENVPSLPGVVHAAAPVDGQYPLDCLFAHRSMIAQTDSAVVRG